MKYSIITINYNNRDGLERTIQSVINQTCQDFEYIIIDGGSTDGSVDVIKKYADKIDYWVSEPDKGIYNAMNKGILQAHGEYLNFMNSGDCFYNDEVLANLLEEGDIIYGNVWYRNIHKEHNYIQLVSLYDLCIHGFNHQSCFFNRNVFKRYQYDENLKVLSDWKLFAQVLLCDDCKIKYVNRIIADYDLTGISSNRDVRINEKKQILYEILPRTLYVDYLRFCEINTPILNLLPELSRTYRLNKIVLNIIKTLLTLKRLLKR